MVTVPLKILQEWHYRTPTGELAGAVPFGVKPPKNATLEPFSYKEVINTIIGNAPSDGFGNLEKMRLGFKLMSAVEEAPDTGTVELSHDQYTMLKERADPSKAGYRVLTAQLQEFIEDIHTAGDPKPEPVAPPPLPEPKFVPALVTGAKETPDGPSAAV